MDDLGGLKVFFRFACDQSPLQMEDPKLVGYTTAKASKGAKIILSYDLREGERTWYKVLRVRIAGKGLKEGESIRIQLGETKHGSPGIRLQTFCEPSFEFRTMVDVFSTNVFLLLPSPKISIVSGQPDKWRAFLPTLRNETDEFELQIRAEDKWGNPTPLYAGTVEFSSSDPKAALPQSYTFTSADGGIHRFEDLVFQTPGIHFVTVSDVESKKSSSSNPVVVQEEPSITMLYWGDLHLNIEEALITVSDKVAWFALQGTSTRHFKSLEDVYYRYGIRDIEHIIKSEQSNKEKLLDILQDAAGILREVNQAGTQFVYPIRVAGTLVKTKGKWKFNQMVFSYPYPRWLIQSENVE